MSTRSTGRLLVPLAVLSAAACVSFGVGCEPPGEAPPPPPVAEPREPQRDPSAEPDTSPTPPAAADFLPEIDGHRTEEAESGELEASLDHGSVPYLEIRRRVILDEQGFASGEVVVATFEPESAGVERYLAHRFGDAPRTPVQVEGVEMSQIETAPLPVLAWTGRGFAVTFARGQERSETWLKDLAGATVRAVRAARSDTSP